jgi:hypothetical protein
VEAGAAEAGMAAVGGINGRLRLGPIASDRGLSRPGPVSGIPYPHWHGPCPWL